MCENGKRREEKGSKDLKGQMVSAISDIFEISFFICDDAVIYSHSRASLCSLRRRRGIASLR